MNDTIAMLKRDQQEVATMLKELSGELTGREQRRRPRRMRRILPLALLLIGTGAVVVWVRRRQVPVPVETAPHKAADARLSVGDDAPSPEADSPDADSNANGKSKVTGSTVAS